MNDQELQMNEVDKKKLKKVTGFVDDKEYATYEELCEIAEHLEGIHENLEVMAHKETPMMEMPEVHKVQIEGVEVITLKGDKGDTGEKGEQGDSGLDGKDGKDGKNGSNGSDGLDGKDGVDGKNGENGKDGSPDDAEQVRDKLASLEEDERLDKSAIKGLDEELKRIEKVAVTYKGGGTSAAGVAHAFKSIFHTEEPSGLINGVNTTYTVKNNIWAIIGFSLNGESIAELPNYTFINHTITFASALPSVYSGKDFEIKYIG